ncbi:MAG: hypothetical protein AAFQ35_13675, partial [Pseudomonadota bacterium]
MECELAGINCEIIEWLSQNSWIQDPVAERLRETGLIKVGREVIANSIEWIVGGITLVIAVYKYYNYRDYVLHKRLLELIQENDASLANGVNRTIRAISRENTSNPSAKYLFSPYALQSIMNKKRWAPAFERTGLGMQSTDRQLNSARKEINRRIALTTSATQSLKAQKAAVGLIRAALSLARADKSSSPEMRTELRNAAVSNI